MGYRPIRTIHDAARHGFFIEAVCPKCGRRGVISPNAFFNQRGNPSIDRLGARLVCKGEVGRNDGHGHRGATVRFVSWPPEPPALPEPAPVSRPAPKGIDQGAWDKADDRGRKRLMRQARG